MVKQELETEFGQERIEREGRKAPLEMLQPATFTLP